MLKVVPSMEDNKMVGKNIYPRLWHGRGRLLYIRIESLQYVASVLPVKAPNSVNTQNHSGPALFDS